MLRIQQTNEENSKRFSDFQIRYLSRKHRGTSKTAALQPSLRPLDLFVTCKSMKQICVHFIPSKHQKWQKIMIKKSAIKFSQMCVPRLKLLLKFALQTKGLATPDLQHYVIFLVKKTLFSERKE